jgi:NitT/TauT family transport system substrate-binding protein
MALSKDIWPDHPCCVIVARDEIIEKFPDALQELTKSFVTSGKYIHANVEKASKIGAEFLKQDYDIVHHVLTNPPNRVTTDKLLPVLEDLDKMQNYLTTKISAMSTKIDLEKFVDMKFAIASGAE